MLEVCCLTLRRPDVSYVDIKAPVTAIVKRNMKLKTGLNELNISLSWFILNVLLNLIAVAIVMGYVFFFCILII